MTPHLSAVSRLAAEVLAGKDYRPRHLVDLERASDEKGAGYYRLFWEMGRSWGGWPRALLEIGTHRGAGAAHWADEGNVRVVTVDFVGECREAVESLGLPNVKFLQCGSHAYADNLRLYLPPGERIFDFLFIDGDHSFKGAYGDYQRLRDFVKPGGIIFMDDIRMRPPDCHAPEMEVVWDYVVDEKLELPELHYSGFGAIQVDPGRKAPPLEAVSANARREIQERLWV